MNIAKKVPGSSSQSRKELLNGKKILFEPKQSQKMCQAFFTNLLLLGFDKEANEKKDNILYNEDTFMVANNKGALTVLHFLLNKLDPDECKSRFRGIWPVFDKKQEQSFRKEICNWLNKVALEEPEANFSHLNPSLFLSPGGYRFQLFLFQLSKFVILKSLKRECGLVKDSYLKCPTLKSQAPQLTDVQVKILKSLTVKHMRSYVDNVKQSLQVHSKWHEQVGEMVTSYRVLCKKVRALERIEKQNAEEKESTVKWEGSQQTKDESLKNAREDWHEFRKTIQSQNEECEIIKSILQKLASQYKIDLNLINAHIPDLLLRVQEHQIQERQIDNLYKEGKLNLVSLVQLLNLSLEMYLEKVKSVGIPSTKENISPMQKRFDTHSNLLQTMQIIRENMKEELHSLKGSVQKSTEEIEKKALDQKLLPMEFTLNAPTPPRNFQLLCDRSVSVDSPLTERCLTVESMETPEAAKKIQLAAKENALKMKDKKTKIENESIPEQFGFYPEMKQEKVLSSKLPIKMKEKEEKESDSMTPQIKNRTINKSLNKNSLRMQVKSLRPKVNSPNDQMENKVKSRSKSMSDFSEKKGVTIWADQIIDHVMGISDVSPQNIHEALSMDAFKSRDKLPRSPIKNSKKKFFLSHGNIPEIEIDDTTISPAPSPQAPNIHLSLISSSSEQLCMTPISASTTPNARNEAPISISASTTPNARNETNLLSSSFSSFLAPSPTEPRRTSQTINGLDEYLELPSNPKALDLDIFDNVPCPKMHFMGLNPGDKSLNRNDYTTSFIEGRDSACPSRLENAAKKATSIDINSTDYFTPLKFGLHLKRSSKSSLLDEKFTKLNHSNLFDSYLSNSTSTFSNSPNKEETIFEEDPVFLVP